MDEPKFAEEIREMQHEPLLPVEKKLIGWSITLGVVLIGALMWLSKVLFG